MEQIVSNICLTIIVVVFILANFTDLFNKRNNKNN